MNNTQKWIAGALGAVFAAAAVGSCQFVPALNGAQPHSVWQDKAQSAVAQQFGIAANNVEFIPNSVRPDGARGVYEGKFMEFAVKGPLGLVEATAKVQCDQERVNGFRGGDITCKVVSVNQFRWSR